MRPGRIKRYYNGVEMPRTTICCSALALALTASLVVSSPNLVLGAPQARSVRQTHAADDKTPLSMFPLTTSWTLPLNNALTCRPAYDEARGFFPIEGDRLVAYELAEGRQLWIASIRAIMEPATGDGLVFVVQPDGLAALRALDGTLVWDLPLADPLAVPPVWDNGWLVTATTTGAVSALRATDGSPIWRQEIGAPAHAPPALAADRVYIATTDSRIVALQVENGSPLWQQRLAKPGNDILSLEDRLYLGSEDNYFYCLDARDGAERWRWRTGGNATGRAVADERAVYFVSFDNVLRALNRHSGVQRWKTPLPLRPSSGPVKALETLLVAGLTPSLRGYNTSDGKAAGDVAITGELAAPPHVFQPARTALPSVIVVTGDIGKGATVTALTRSFEPANAPVAELPNSVPVPPILPPHP